MIFAIDQIFHRGKTVTKPNELPKPWQNSKGFVSAAYELSESHLYGPHSAARFGLDPTSRNSLILWREVPSTHLLFGRSIFLSILGKFREQSCVARRPKAHQEDHYEPVGSMNASTILYR